jgi:hypothetical protein
VIRGYCSAVRSALTDDGHPPVDASGLKLHGRLRAVADSLARVEKRGPCPRRSNGFSVSCTRDSPTPLCSGPSCVRPMSG